MEDLVDQKEDRERLPGAFHDLMQASNLRIEHGTTLVERVLNANRGSDRERRQPQPARRDGRPGQTQRGVHPHRSQQGALPRHIGATHDEQPQLGSERDVVGDAAARRQQGMPQGLPFEAGFARSDLRKAVFRVLVVKTGQARERLEFAYGVDPRTQ